MLVMMIFLTPSSFIIRTGNTVWAETGDRDRYYLSLRNDQWTDTSASVKPW